MKLFSSPLMGLLTRKVLVSLKRQTSRFAVDSVCPFANENQSVTLVHDPEGTLVLKKHFPNVI